MTPMLVQVTEKMMALIKMILWIKTLLSLVSQLTMAQQMLKDCD